MSARDSAGPAGPGNSGAGGLGNGGLGGGMGGGLGGGGYGGGMSGNTGLGTGAQMYGNTAFGRPGGMALGYAMRDPNSLNMAGMGPMAGSYSQYRGLNGQPMFQGQVYNGMGAMGGYNQFSNQNVQPGGVMSHVLGAPPTQQPSIVPAYAPPPQQPVGLHPLLTKANLPAFFGGPRKGITDRVPQDPTFPGNTFNPGNGMVGYSPGPNGYGR